MLWTIVVPLDGTDSAAHALPVGIALATAASASIRVIGIAPTDAELPTGHSVCTPGCGSSRSTTRSCRSLVQSRPIGVVV